MSAAPHHDGPTGSPVGPSASRLPRVKKLLRLAAAAARDGGRAARLARIAIRRHHALQRSWELTSLLQRARALRPRVVVEIGTHRGGTLFCWARVAAADAHLVSIDIPNPAEGMGAGSEDEARFHAFLRPGQRLSCLRSDSHLPATRDALLARLGGAPIDLLWIDGDHSLAGVRADWMLYGPLVRPGGLVAFHDIHPNPALPGNQVAPLWRELRERYPSREYIDQDHPGGVGMGIGVLEIR